MARGGHPATRCADPAGARRAAEITDLEGQRAMLTTRISAEERAADSLAARRHSCQDAIRRHEQGTTSYMMSHKLAVAAIVTTTGGGAVALDPNNAFSDEARLVAGAIGLIAAIWALDNADEVSASPRR